MPHPRCPHTRPSRRGRSRGAALTEFVIVAPVLVAIVYGSLYLTDLGGFKLTAQEIARYAAWGLAVRPLSDFQNFNHTQQFSTVRQSVANELNDVYGDLDGADETLLPLHVKDAETMSAVYVPPSSMDLRDEQVDLLPGALSGQWAQSTSVLGILLSVLNIGTGTQSLFAGPFHQLRLDTEGQVEGRATVLLEPPIRADNAARDQALAAIAKQRGADLSAWSPKVNLASFLRLRDITASGQQRDIAVTLIADSWRLPVGYAANPDKPGLYSNVVHQVSDKALTALPGGSIINLLFSLYGYTDKLPGGLTEVFGFPPSDPTSHVFSRPYIGHRQSQTSHQGTPATGQVNIFNATDAQGKAEQGAVELFETGALYVDPNDPGNSAYLQSLNERGNYFMGCDQAQQRRCPWQ